MPEYFVMTVGGERKLDVRHAEVLMSRSMSTFPLTTQLKMPISMSVFVCLILPL